MIAAEQTDRFDSSDKAVPNAHFAVCIQVMIKVRFQGHEAVDIRVRIELVLVSIGQ